MTGTHRHHEVEINFLERGTVTYLINGTLATVPAGTLALFWATIPHQLVRAEKAAADFHWFHVPLAWLLLWKMPPSLIKPLLEGRLILDPSPAAWDAARVRDWASMFSRKNPAWKTIVLLEIQARLHSLALQKSAPANTREIVHTGNLLKVEEIARFIAEHYCEPLTVEEIAKNVRLHPSYTMNLFRKHSGQTLLECVTQHRIAHAQRLLVTTADKVLNIALESGFGSLSRFYEAFEAACHTTPLRYRRTFTSG